MMEGLYWPLFLIVLLVLVNGFFALAEIALVTVRPTQISGMIDDGVPGARRLKRVVQDPDRFMSTIQVAITLSGFLASASATATLAQPLGIALATLGVSEALAGWLAIILVTAAVSYLSLVLGELVPKQLALHFPRALALRVARPVEWFGVLLYPFVAGLSASTRLVLKAFRVSPNDVRSTLSEEELTRLVVEHRTLEENEKEMIKSVFDFGDALVREIMVPRADTVAIQSEARVEDAVKLVRETGYSRLPVFTADLDQTQGIVTAKDLLGAFLDGAGQVEVERFARKTLVVPETKRALALLQDMRQKRTHMAIVVDEYGSLAGIVTIEDLLEEIVGEIQDETDPALERKIVPLGNNEFRVDPRIRLEELSEHFGVSFSDADDTYETLAGFLLAQFQRVPSKGEALEYASLQMVVEEVQGFRIERVRIVRKI